MSETPDAVIIHRPEGCRECGFWLGEVDPASIEKHQVFDLPLLNLSVSIEAKQLPVVANLDSAIQPVGGKKANKLGLYDLSGNVWEWCFDWYGSYLDALSHNPAGAN